jgi:hypothetical protein
MAELNRVYEECGWFYAASNHLVIDTFDEDNEKMVAHILPDVYKVSGKLVRIGTGKSGVKTGRMTISFAPPIGPPIVLTVDNIDTTITTGEYKPAPFMKDSAVTGSPSALASELCINCSVHVHIVSQILGLCVASLFIP